jgi:hypothetical protein
MVEYFKGKEILQKFFNLVTGGQHDEAAPFRKVLRIVIEQVRQQPVLCYDYSKDIEIEEKQLTAAEIIEKVHADPSLVSPYFTGSLERLNESCFLDDKFQ